MPGRPPHVSEIQGQRSWTFASDHVEAALTCEGGHLAPVTFHTDAGQVQPFSVAPWTAGELAPGAPDVLRMLRGDFFCAPFGGNGTPWRGERHPVHGESAGSRWSLVRSSDRQGRAMLEVALRTQVRPGRIVKRIELRPGETNVYCRHVLSGMSGPLSLGHHTMLRFSDESGDGRLALSPWRLGRVCPVPFEDPAQGGYSALRTGAAFRSLDSVPLADGGLTDLSAYPARAGFDDLAMVCSRLPRRGSLQPAWSTVTFPKGGYLWFSLKDPRVLASTVLWFSNGGRHYPPWNGRHHRVLGIEEATSFFHLGLAASAVPNALSRRGVKTALRLSPKAPLSVAYVMGVAAIPPGFDVVSRIGFHRDHAVFFSRSGHRLEHPVDLGFLQMQPTVDPQAQTGNR